MNIIKIWNDSPSDKQLQEISSILENGGLIIFPTDTIYAIGCDALNIKAVDKLCNLKNINPNKSNLSIICGDISMAADYSKIDNKVFRIIKNNTPGAFTFLLPTSSALPKAFKGRKIVGIRIPDSNTARLLAQTLGHPILTTSIEYEDEDHAVNPGLIAENYSKNIDLFVEGEEGSTTPSTIIDLASGEPEIIREGKGEIDII